MTEKGLILVISGPSGAGKGSIIKPYMKKHPECRYSVSITTRPPRNEDKDGVTYHFKTKEEVENMIKNDELLEWDSYCDNYYGTPVKYITDSIEAGFDCILEITVPGALDVRRKIPECVMIYIAPPSFEELERRITKRGTEDPETIRARMDKAKWELNMMEQYDYIIINNCIEEGIRNLENIVEVEKIRYIRCNNTLNKLGLIQEGE